MGEEKEIDRLVKLTWSEAERKEAKREGSSQAAQVKAEGQVVTQWGVYRPETMHVAVGDQIRTTAACEGIDGKAMNNGTRFTVTGIGGDRLEVLTPNKIRRVLPLDAKHLSHAYCQTSFSSQSRTADAVIVAESGQSFPAADRAQMYATASRGRVGIRVYTDDYPASREAVDRDRKKADAHDLLKPEKPSKLKVRALFVSRIKGIAAKAVGKVRQLTHRKEKDYDYER